ncbi:hypothetical protein FNF27_06510 [Cafeteria roenbergensis]|uniref:Protein CASP n=4 Tax=Cafeteria roenbergensis TaxID=33653 RepID=A0A5A8DZ54_CAFRO|nr:hypothetical protein FNF31_03250 [Cafeteria roenbergensis]KAA0170471.1 hypothetical protein FNF28_01465 [Cafeteria roenbergensis]KAA0170813.1 hypothetical protein FNF27_06510 [Cafeteria roenbergensis]
MAVAGAGGKGRLGPAGPRELSAAQSAGKTSPDEASIEQALAWWKRFDLSGQRERLDKVSIEITDKQAAAQENRKSLTEALMRFRRASESERPDMFGSLVSKFKDEVDFLTRRARFGERAFVSLYSALFEAPDPAPPLAQGSRLAAELVEAAAAVSQLKAERDAQARQAEALRGHDAEMEALTNRLAGVEAGMAEAAAAAAAERESDLRSVFADEARELREEARAALARAAAAEAETGASLRALADAERRWAEQRARLEDEAAQAAESAEVVAAEAERLRAETVALRAEGARREATSARARAGAGSGEGSGVASDEGEGGTSSAPASSESSSSSAAAGLLARTAEAEAEASRLADSLEAAEGEVHRWRATVEQARAERAEAEARTAEVRSRAETETAALRAELDRRPTCAERAALRREVATLKRVLFSSALRPRREDKGRGSSSRPRLGLGGEAAAGAEADEEEDDDSGSVVSDAGSTVSDTLSDAGGEQDPDDAEGAARKRRTLTESALRRVRHLEAVVLARRRELEGARAECSRLREELDGARETIQDLRGDVAKLEREATVLAGASEAGSAGGGRGEALAQPGAAARAGDRRPARGEDGAPVGGSAGAQGAGDSARDALEEAIGHSRKAAATVQGTAGGVGGTDASAEAASQAGEGGGERRAGEALPAAQAVPPASVADVLRSQRNRFRARVGELEGEVSLAQRAASEAEAAREALESDNVALWEAVRLVRRSPGLTDAEIAARIGSRDALPRYGRLFRERTDPFAALEAGRAEGAAVRTASGRHASSGGGGAVGGVAARQTAVRRRREARLGPLDKAALLVVRGCAVSRGVRAGVALYLAGLHVMAFVLLWLYTHVRIPQV